MAERAFLSKAELESFSLENNVVLEENVEHRGVVYVILDDEFHYSDMKSSSKTKKSPEPIGDVS